MEKQQITNSNGDYFKLDSETLFSQHYAGNGITEKWYRDADTGEVIIAEEYYVTDSGDSCDKEFDIVEVIPAGGLAGRLLSENDHFWDKTYA